MKTKDFTKIGKQLLPQLPGFVMEKKVMFQSPVEDLMRGLYFEGSADADRFYLSVFFMPLFVPNDSIHGTFSKRIVSGNNWRADNPNLLADLTVAIQSQAMPFLDDVATLTGAFKYLKGRCESTRPRVNSHTLEALAYTLIKSGDYSSAFEALAELKQMLEGDTIPWVVAQFNRAQLIEGKLSQSPDAALAQLEAWKDETISKLGLEKYRERGAA